MSVYENTNAMSMSENSSAHWHPMATFRDRHDRPNSWSDYSLETLSEHTTGQDVEKVAHTPGSGTSTQDILSVVAIVIMLAWPWAFFFGVWVKGGVQLSDHTAKAVMNDPSGVTYLITLIGGIISLITGALFSIAIMRFAQELVSHRKTTQPFHLKLLLAFQYRTWPWSVKDVKYLMNKDRWWPAILLIACIFTFPHSISSTTSLIIPIPFSRTAVLTGTELDFSSPYADCQTWFNEHPLNNTCGYQSYKDLQYTNCLGENQMVDVLQSGRGNILELVSNNTQSLTFSQLGAEGGLHFLGPIRGVLPIGPNGVPAFDTLKPSPFSNPKIMAGMISYNYTLNHQGLTSNVSCSYASTYPFQFDTLDPGYSKILTYNASCATLGEIEVLTDVNVIPAVNSYNFMAYWACQSAPNGLPTDSYSIYLAGLNNYASEFGNIICIVDPIQTAVFPVTYQATPNIFTVATPEPKPSPITFSTLMTHALVGLGEVINEGQNFQANLVAESVLTFGAKYYGLQPNQSNPEPYLWLFEQMIQGLIEYEASYLRLIYSTVPDPPSSCTRTVNGLLKYQVLGWFVTRANIAYLIPITIINVAALVVLSIAMRMERTGGYIFHGFYPSPVTHAEQIDQQEQVPDKVKLLGKHFYENVERKNVQADEHHPNNSVGGFEYMGYPSCLIAGNPSLREGASRG